MFTNSGSSLLAKYMLGQLPAFATHIAIGCGTKALTTEPSGNPYINQSKLDFETYRSKIISRGYVNNGGVPELSLIAELPTNNRYGITEIALFPGLENPSAKDYDSRILLNFVDESYVYSSTSITDISSTTINIPNSGTISDSGKTEPFFISSSDGQLTSEDREKRLEAPRFLDKALIMKSTSTGVVEARNINIDLSKNSPEDYVSLAYSFLNDAVGDGLGVQNTYTVTMQLMTSSETDYYTHSFTIDAASLTDSRYNVEAFQIKDLTAVGTSPTLYNINRVRFSIAKTGGSATELNWLLLDGLRIDNTSSFNSSFGLVAYKVIVNPVTIGMTTLGMPIIKASNTTNFIEFRFRLDVT
jgi:hypothetical protein